MLLKNYKIINDNNVQSEKISKFIDILSSKGMKIIEQDVFDENINVNSNDISIVIAVGGDGTIIKAAKVALNLNAPICGVNFGHLGFLAGVDFDEDIDIITDKIVNKKYNIDRRFLLDVKVVNENNEVTFEDVAINEAQLLATDLNKVSVFYVYQKNVENLLYDFASCGLLIATPTGSTGFSFSAGGPIVSPKVQCFILQPIYPHAFNQRSFVVEDNDNLLVVIDNYNQSLYIDGRKLISLKKNDIINISKCKKYIDFIELTNKAFYKNIKKKIRNI